MSLADDQVLLDDLAECIHETLADGQYRITSVAALAAATVAIHFLEGGGFIRDDAEPRSAFPSLDSNRST